MALLHLHIPSPNHKFNTALGCGVKTFDVTLTVTDIYGCSSSLTKQITVKQKTRY